MFCPNCGTELLQGTTFCSVCGTELSKISELYDNLAKFPSPDLSNTANKVEFTQNQGMQQMQYPNQMMPNMDMQQMQYPNQMMPNMGMQQMQYPNQYPPQQQININIMTQNEPKKSSKNKYIAVLLALIFGEFGFHKFYLGKTGWGILYLLLCWTGIPYCVSIIEAIMYLCTSEENWNRKY